MAVKKAENNVWRIVAVLLGVFGSCWLFANNWRDAANYILNYKITENFITYFFGKGLFTTAALFTAMLFIIASLKDLGPIVKGFSLVTAVICAVVFLAYVVYFCVAIRSVADVTSYGFFRDVGLFLMSVAYFLFAMYCRNGGGIKNVAWVFALAGMFVVLFSLIFGIAAGAIKAGEFVNRIFVVLANAAMLYCGLRQY